MCKSGTELAGPTPVRVGCITHVRVVSVRAFALPTEGRGPTHTPELQASSGAHDDDTRVRRRSGAGCFEAGAALAEVAGAACAEWPVWRGLGRRAAGTAVSACASAASAAAAAAGASASSSSLETSSCLTITLAFALAVSLDLAFAATAARPPP